MTRSARLQQTVRAALALLMMGLACSIACADSPCPGTLTADIPAHSNTMPSGSAFARSIASKVREQRDAVSTSAILRGDMPPFLRRLQAVTLHAYTDDGEPLAAIVCVMPDYLAVGSDSDFLRIPLAFAPALTIAQRFGFVLPTPRMVDAICRESAAHLRPQPLRASDAMRSTAYFTRHDADIDRQIKMRGIPFGVLIAGHKKDVVLSNRLDRHPGRIAIYGWHEPNGEPIQPLSTRHGAAYVDYSHGIRLVSDAMLLNGRTTSVHRVLSDRRLAVVLSDEGVVGSLARFIPARSASFARLQQALLGASAGLEQ